MMRGCLGILAALQLCVLPGCAVQHSPAETGGGALWGPSSQGIRTRLSADKRRYGAGEPILLRLEMKNEHSRSQVYGDQQVAVNDPFVATGPGGEQEEYLKGTVMTVGRSKPIHPGGVIVLLEGYNLGENYDVGRPGRYTVQFRGRRGGFPPEVDIPASNRIAVDVEP